MKFENHQHYNCEIEIDSGEKFKISANWMHNNGLDYWQGWECGAGYQRLDIDKDFNVHSAVCQNEYLGNLFGKWRVLDRPGICKRERCIGCTDDLIVEKRHVDKDAN